MEVHLNLSSKTVVMRLGKETINMGIAPISRNITGMLRQVSIAEGDPFSFIMEYLHDTLTVDEMELLFNKYKEVDLITRQVDDLAGVKMIAILEDIIEIINYDRLVEWTINNDKIKPPDDIADTYDTDRHDEGLTTRSKTYIKSEYIRLIAYVLMSRLVAVAIYGFDTRLSDFYRKDVKLTMYFGWLSGTVMRESEEYKKLYRYVVKNREDKFNREPDTRETFRSIMSLRGLDELDEEAYVMGTIVLGHLALYPVLETNDGKNLIKKIYRTAVYTLNNNSEQITNPIKVKRTGGDETDADDSLSVIENHRVSSRLSPGIIAEIKFYYASAYNVFNKKSKYKVDWDLYKEIINDAYDPLINESITRSQLILTNAILTNVINGEALLYVKKESVIEYMVLAATICHQLGFPNVCKLLLSIQDTTDSHVLTTQGSKVKISDEYIAKGNAISPYIISIYKHRKVTADTGSVAALIDNVLLTDLTSVPRITATTKTNVPLYGSDSRTIWIEPNLTEHILDAVASSSIV